MQSAQQPRPPSLPPPAFDRARSFGVLPTTVGADLKAGVVVFLVALPLCLGIATVSGAPPISGLIAGIVGGSVVAFVSASRVSVAGPAAGLTVLVIDGIHSLGFPSFLLATVLAGAIQIALGTLRVGRVVQLVPNAVIKGMLAAIGLILILKQVPHAFGYDADFEGDFAFQQPNGGNTFGALAKLLGPFQLGPIVASAAAVAALLLWRRYGRLDLTRYAPRELIAVLTGIACALWLRDTPAALAAEHRVQVPLVHQTGWDALWIRPDFASLGRLELWSTAVVIAIVASIESLLCVEATDQLDPEHRVSSPNRELVAQGLGNMLSGMLGGLPVTAVVVRSFANIQAGARSHWASVSHAVLLVVAALAFGAALNLVPLASLSAILIAVAYKLTPPALYKQMWARGHQQFVPFLSTVLCILFTDLLKGTLLGVLFSTIYVLAAHYHAALTVFDDGRLRFIRLAANVSFLHKIRMKHALSTAGHGAHVVVDGTTARSVDLDVLDMLQSFERQAPKRGITLSIRRSPSAFHHYFRKEQSA